MAKGSLVQLFSSATKIAQTRHDNVMRQLDRMTQTDSPSAGGGTLTRGDHVTLLAYDEQYQGQQLAKLPWMTGAERDRLGRDLQRAVAMFPNPLPASVAEAPENPLASPDSPQVPEMQGLGP